MGVVVVALVTLVATGILAARRPGVISMGCLLGAAAFWVTSNTAVDGPVIVLLSPSHGLHVADLVAVLIVGEVAVAVTAKGAMQRRG